LYPTLKTSLTGARKFLTPYKLLPNLPNLNLCRPAALIALSGHNHIVPLTKLQVALAPPLIKVLARVDGAADTLGAPDRPILVEGRRADNRRLVDAPCAVDVVHAAIVLDRAEAGGTCRRVVCAVGFDDVVLDQRVGGPSVERKVCFVSLSSSRPRYRKVILTAVDIVVVPSTVIRNLTRRAGVPSLAANPIVHVVPAYAIRAARAWVEVDCARVVLPEGIEEAIVRALAWLDAALEQFQRAGGHLGHRRREGGQEECEGDHYSGR